MSSSSVSWASLLWVSSTVHPSSVSHFIIIKKIILLFHWGWRDTWSSQTEACVARLTDLFTRGVPKSLCFILKSFQEGASDRESVCLIWSKCLLPFPVSCSKDVCPWQKGLSWENERHCLPNYGEAHSGKLCGQQPVLLRMAGSSFPLGTLLHVLVLES